ncbi:MAG: S9 family peptidase [Steroidobacteraceae bacterium]
MPHRRPLPILAVAVFTVLGTLPAAHAGRALEPEDWYRFKAVSDLVIAPDGSAVAYIVTRYDKASDESRGALWLAAWNGKESLQLTRGESVSVPRFSPDGRYLSFLSARPGDSSTQLWLLDRRGGEPRQLTHVPGEILDYAWSRDGTRLVLVMRAAEGAGKEGETHPPKPLVIDSLLFKQDTEGYLTDGSRTHLYLLAVGNGVCQALTADPASSDSLPAFSPDGGQIAYVSHRRDTPQQLGVDQIELVAATPGAKPRRLLTTWSPNQQHLEWTPDGTRLVFLQGAVPKYTAYILDALAVAEVPSGRMHTLTGALDRAAVSPAITTDGRAIEFAVEDDGYQYAAKVPLEGGEITRLANRVVITELAAAAGHTAVLASSDRSPVEVYALESGKLRPLSAQNRALFAELTLGTVDDIAFRSKDGTEIHGQVVKPPDYVAGRAYPTIVWIHGGPNGQDDHSLELEGYGPQLERQLFATHGYVVLAINYSGSSGRGVKFARSIFADWGDKEVQDLEAGADYAVAQGWADPRRLGVGGWSYGGLLTDYLIASTTRFKAAISGAGSGNQTAMYGVDQYVLEYSAEMGPPWRTTSRWLEVSYPFFHADRIRTPTLFLGGDKDFNVPLAGGEQMYEALRTLGVPTELIVYPGEYHVLSRPSFLVDRFARYLDWMAKYLKTGS